MSAAAAWAARHARAVLAISALLALAAAVLATALPTDAGTDTLVDTDTPAYRATQELRETFGEDPVVVLARGDLQNLLLTANLGQLLRLESCLSGKVPPGARPIPGPCAELARLKAVRFVSGPATFLNEAVIQISRQLSRLAATVPPDRLREFALSIATEYGITSPPSLGNPDFTAAVVFDRRRAAGTPKARLAYLFPNRHSAQIVLRMRPDLSDSERHRALELIREATTETTPRAACKDHGIPAPCFRLKGGSYVVSGVPVVVDGLSRSLVDALWVLLGAAVAAMALALILVFRSHLRLLPLALALAAAALTFGLFGLLGGSLTMASIAVLPILIGLAVDYAIQFQARFDEEEENGLTGAEAAVQAASRGGPAIATACIATAAGFLALLLSPTPMVRSFGLLLVIGVGIAFVLALTVGFAALSLRSSGGWQGVRGAEDEQRLAHKPPSPPDRTRPPEGLVSLGVNHPRWVLGVGLALSVVGWGAGTQIESVSDVRELAPQSIQAVRDLNELQDATGVSGELDVRIKAPDLTDPATLRWMAGFKHRVLIANGFSGPDPSCKEAEVCPGPALSDFVVGTGGAPLRRADVRATLRELPPYDLQQVAPADPRTGLPGHTALVSFGIRAQSLEDQQALIERIRGEIGEPGAPGGPPAGVNVELAGLPVVAAAAANDLSSSRYWIGLAGLLAVALVLLAVYRSFARALVPLAPVVLAGGWSALVLWVSGIPLNPMSATLTALTIAIATEFSVILSARFHEERGAGHAAAEALRAAYTRTGAAVLASAITATAGFAVLIVSDVTMLRDFGVVTVIDLSVALLGVMVALPAALVLWGER